MKGKRHTTEEKSRALPEVDGGKPIRVVCQERNISKVTMHRWWKLSGPIEVNAAKRLREPERENGELNRSQFPEGTPFDG